MSTKSFLGVPVQGDVSRTEKRAQQRPLEELAPLFEAVLADPLIAEFGWSQYTPYFNDGDPCVFGAQEPWFRTTQDGDDTDEDSLSLDYSTHPTLGERKREYTGRWPDRTVVSEEFVSAHPETLKRCLALSDAIGSDAFDDVLQDNFGDHARITVRRDGIEVEFYEHD